MAETYYSQLLLIDSATYMLIKISSLHNIVEDKFMPAGLMLKIYYGILYKRIVAQCAKRFSTKKSPALPLCGG